MFVQIIEISLSVTASIVYAAILKNKLKMLTGIEIREHQCSFRKVRTYVDDIFIVKHLLEKRRKFNLPLYAFYFCL